MEQVKAKFVEVKKRKAEAAKNEGKGFEERLAIAYEDEDAARARKKAKEAAKKAKKKAEDEAKTAELGGLDPEMAAMMGFAGFGGGKK